MLRYIRDINGDQLNAKISIEDGGVILHSRGGAFGKPNLRNPDYRKALTTIISRLVASDLEPSRVLIDSSEAHKVSKAKRVLLKKADFARPVEELVREIGKRVAAFGRDPNSSGHGNSTKRVRIEVTRASAQEIEKVLNYDEGKGTGGQGCIPPIIYFNIGWMKDYNGPKLTDPTLGRHRWLSDHAHGHECFNFTPTSEKTVQGYRPPGKLEKTNIDRLGAKPGDGEIGGILVVWFAREPKSRKSLIVGWYRNATVYREARNGDFEIDQGKSVYSASASVDDAVLVPTGLRSFELRSGQKDPGAGFGQKPTWYGEDMVNERVWAYVNSWGAIQQRSKSRKRKNPPKNTNAEIRRKVEKAAVDYAWQYYQEKYYYGCTIESVESLGRGWDLEVRTDSEEWLVEVKGLLNAVVSCELTPNEYEKMQLPAHRKKYVIFVVNNALAEEPGSPIPSIFMRCDDGKWRTEDGRELQVSEKVGAVLKSS